MPVGRSYTEAEVERGLHAVALASGNVRLAARTLSKDGFKISPHTLTGWKVRTHVERYQEIQEEVLPRVYAQIAERNEEIANQAADLEQELLIKIKGDIHSLDAKDQATALRNVTVTKGINLQHANIIHGNPTSIVEHRSDTERLETALKALENQGVITVDSEAEELDVPELPA